MHNTRKRRSLFLFENRLRLKNKKGRQACALTTALRNAEECIVGCAARVESFVPFTGFVRGGKCNVVFSRNATLSRFVILARGELVAFRNWLFENAHFYANFTVSKKSVGWVITGR